MSEAPDQQCCTSDSTGINREHLRDFWYYWPAPFSSPLCLACEGEVRWQFCCKDFWYVRIGVRPKGEYIKVLDQIPNGAKLARASGIWMYSMLLKLQSSGFWTKNPVCWCLRKKKKILALKETRQSYLGYEYNRSMWSRWFGKILVRGGEWPWFCN